jgi:hypothetical protein
MTPRQGKEKAMRYQCALSMTLAIAGGSATASAAFTGFTVQYAGSNSSTGAEVYWVFANFDQSDDVIVNFNGFQRMEGSVAGIRHTDGTGLQGGDAWNPSYTLGPQASTDSFVSINGVTGSTSVTSLSGFGSSGIANGAGWGWTSGASTAAVGSTFQVRIAQFAGHFSGGNGFIASLNISYRDNMNSTTAMSGFGTFLIGGAVPSPGALALLGIAGLGRSRRR